MRKLAITLSALSVLTFAAAPEAPAQTGTRIHTWVSNGGNDSSADCDVGAPCATFGVALTKTKPGGEITCLNSGNFQGGFLINHSVTISCEGAIGSNQTGTFAGGIGVRPAAGDIVILRGLDVDGATVSYSSPDDGLIAFDGAGTLRLEKMKISKVQGRANGVYFGPIGAAKLHVVDSIIAYNGSSGLAAGIYIKPASGVTANVAIEHSYIENNNFGIFADATGGGIIKGVVIDSIVTGNTNNGITVSSSGALAVLALDNTKVANNANGLVAGGSAAAMLVSRSFVVNNGTGLVTSGGGNLYSYRNNQVNFNTGGGDGAFTQFLGLQ